MRTIIAASIAATILASVAPTGSTDVPLERFRAFAVDISNTAPRAAASTVDIAINRWSTDEQRDQLLSVFKEKGQDGLLSALRDQAPVGFIRTPDSLSYDLRFARQHQEAEGGRMIFLMTDRPIRMWEAMNSPRTIDYPFTLIQLQVDKDGNGVGKASIATRIRQADDTIELENFSSLPVRLNEVRRVQ
jgi:hypothetical protein